MAMALWNNMVRGYNLDPYVFVEGVPTKDDEKGVWNKRLSKT